MDSSFSGWAYGEHTIGGVLQSVLNQNVEIWLLVDLDFLVSHPQRNRSINFQLVCHFVELTLGMVNTFLPD
jgi:hypothetical protein